MPDFSPRDRQELEVLAGTGNPGARDLAAVRVGDMSGIIRMRREARSSAVTAPPTAAEFNALVDDVAELRRALVEMSEKLADRMNPRRKER